GERGLDLHDAIGFLFGLVGRVAEELEGLDHVVDVALAKLLEARRFIEVVVAVGKGESALSCGSDLLGGVLLILRDGGGEEGATTAAILLRVEGCELLDAGELVDGFEVRLQGLSPSLSIRSVFMQAAK